MNLQAAIAFKNSGAGSGLSVDRIADAMNRDVSIAEFQGGTGAVVAGALVGLLFPPSLYWTQRNAPIALCSADYRHTGERLSTGVTSALGSTAAQVGTGAIVASDNPSAIGQQPRAQGGTVLDTVSSLWANVPTIYKVSSAAVLVIAGVGVVGYTVRAFK